MNFLFVIAATVSLIVAPLSFFLFFSMERYRKRVRHLELQLASLNTQADVLQKDAEEIRALRAQNSRYLEEKSIALTERTESQKKLEASEVQREAALRQKEEAIAARMQAEKKLELMEQKMQEGEKRMLDWEMQRSESLKAAKASILEAGGQLSSKLLEDHKRESEAAKKEAEAVAKKTSEALVEQVVSITQSVAALKDQTGENREKMATVWRALTTPAGAGYMAEVGLENSLKNLGLEAGRDYIMQYSIGGQEAGSLRPDAVIFLQQDMVMVIDSKASKFLMEIAEAQNVEAEAESLQRLKKTMNDHLKALVSKDYGAAILAAYKEAGRGQKISTIHNVMYLPSENAVSHIKRADSEFMQKIEKGGIILAGPASLAGLLSLARLNIGMGRQAENQNAIIDSVQDLMDNVITVLSYADKVGRGLKSAADNFDQFARSVNKRMLPKVRQLISLGVKPSKNKELPNRIASYDIRLADEMLTIEGEVEAVEDYNVIETFPKKVSA